MELYAVAARGINKAEAGLVERGEIELGGSFFEATYRLGATQTEVEQGVEEDIRGKLKNQQEWQIEVVAKLIPHRQIQKAVDAKVRSMLSQGWEQGDDND